MLQFRKNDTTADIILTLTEMVTITNPHYLFVFTHVTTKDVVSFVKSESDDISNYKDRYNKFVILPSIFNIPGEYHYKVYEQSSTTNTDVSLTGNLLEQGKLMLLAATDFAYTEYNSTTTFKTYNG